jgi:hypothetical protein
VVEFSASFAEKLAKLVRLPSSDRAGEVTDAVAGINRMLANGGADIHTIADFIEHGLPNGTKTTKNGKS